MAIIKCRECDHEISDEAKVCPNCGCPTQPKKRVNKPIFIPLLLAGIAMTLWGAVLIWDSMLWLLPEPYNVPQADWKEFGIGSGFLALGIVLSFFGCSLSAEKGHFLTNNFKIFLPLSLIGLVILLGLIFKIEINHPHWFTRHTIVTAMIDGEEQSFDVRMRYFIEISEE